MGVPELLGMMVAVTISLPGLIGLLVIILTSRLPLVNWGGVFVALVVARGILAAVSANRMFVRDVQAFAITTAVLYSLVLLAVMLLIAGVRHVFNHRPREDAPQATGISSSGATALAFVVWQAGSIITFIYLTFFDGYPYTAWNWIIAVPVNLFLGEIWPIYWLLLR